METTQEVQEVLDKLKNTISTDKDFAETFTAAIIAKHNAETAAAAAAAAVSVAASAPSATAVGPASVETNHFNEHQQQSEHDQLQRIAEQHQAEIEKGKQQLQEQLDQLGRQPKEESAHDPSIIQTTENQDEHHQQVLQHIATAAAAAEASTLATVPITIPPPAPTPIAKPAPGSEEWHKMRRDNHKEVERRRRETINEGINDLAKMIPNCDKNKGSILRQAVKYIQTLITDSERFAGSEEQLASARFEVEKYKLEKGVAEATHQSLSLQHEQLKREYDELRKKMDDLEEHASKKQRTE